MSRRLTHSPRHVIAFPGGIQNPMTGDVITQITVSDEHFHELAGKAKKEGLSVKEYALKELARNRYLFPQADASCAGLTWLIYELRKKGGKAK